MQSTILMPELPRILNKREARITPRIMDWFDKNYPDNWFIEVKQTTGNTIPFSAVKPHQLKALKAIRSKQGMKHKLSDAGHTRQPFDAFGVKKSHSFVVACFLKHHIALVIDPNKWSGASYNDPCEFKISL